MTYITKLDQLKAMGMADINHMAADLITRQPGLIKQRAESRERYILEILSPLSLQKQIFVLLEELIGQGGHNDLGCNYGGSSERTELFRTCGKGRRHATDGAAWDSAIKSTFYKLVTKWAIGPDETLDSIILRVDSDDVLVLDVVGRNGKVEGLWLFDEDDLKEDLDELDKTTRWTRESQRRFLGQVILACTRDQSYIALSFEDNAYEDGRYVAYSGIAIDPSVKSKVGLLADIYAYYL